MSPKWEGVFCALWTPTDAQGQLLEVELASHLEFLKQGGVHGLLTLGSTGEFLHLEPALRKRMIEKLADLVPPLRSMVNISDLRPSVVADLARCARRSGAAAVSVLPPYFYPVAQEDLIEFFVRAGEAAQLPLFLYNFPERTGNRIALETIAAVAERIPVAGVKQSGNEFAYHGPLVELGREKGFVVMTGADTRVPEAVALGVSGCVSGLSNAIPELVVASLATARRLGTTSLASERMAELGRRIHPVHFPLDVAAAMEARGLPVGACKSVMSAATQARYDLLVEDLRGLFREWQLV